ncbi:MAG TPA: HAMP domain-containing sensor histidine kinase [Candidatus Udaeobacter sp.]|jgi:signal transduction histidine kinase
MSAAIATRGKEVASFRTRLFTAIMVIVATLTAFGFYLAQRRVTADAERNLQQAFQTELSSTHKIEELRHASLADRCNTLVAKPRIHAAIEDDAIDLLYPTAKDELRDLMEGEEPPADQAARSLHARFYRFLDDTGAVIKPPNPSDVGELDAATEAQLSLKKLPDTQQVGYIQSAGDIHEVIAVPIFSTDTGELVSALVIGFKPLEVANKNTGMQSGIWVDGHLHLPALAPSAQSSLNRKITPVLAKSDSEQNYFRVEVAGAPQLLFHKRLNPGSLFPPAYEIFLYPLASWTAQLNRLRWQIGGAGALLLLGGFVASHFVARSMSAPVKQLALDSEENRAERERAEAALASTTEELERSTRYSADASHQLKSPMTILRIGLESLLAREGFKPEVYEELSTLLHQTRRLTGVIEDLLLLSQMDAGHLQIASSPVNLSQLVDEWLDDLGALPESPDVKIEKEFPRGLFVAGEKRYMSLIIQNLLENARKYNRAGGRIRVSATGNGRDVMLTIGNTGRTIPPGENIFERFHHSSSPSAASGHGIGLNLARQLTRLHGGELRLVRSEKDWTEFEVRFSAANGVNAVT